jgi:hypothetical protein
MDLDNSKRVLLKASYVQVELSDADHRHLENRPSHGLEKANFLRQLALTRDEVRALRHSVLENQGEHFARMLDASGELARSNRELAATLAVVPAEAFVRLADLVPRVRQSQALALATQSFAQRVRIAPVGRLHLERLEMFPSGTEKGELVFTVPLTPTETVTVSHKEWSTSKDEYESIVDDFFESYSERGVVDKTDASISSENESKHTSAFTFGATTSGGYGPVSVSVSVGLTNGSEDRQAAKQSTQSTREITEKASSRTRQEHRVSVKLENTRGSEDASYRTITNPHADKALRVDYYRMMRKWRIDHLRYGLRLTFDVAVPNPGATLWAKYRELVDLDTALRAPFTFPLTVSGITHDTWDDLATAAGIALEPPPAKGMTMMVSRRFEAGKRVEGAFEWTAQPGYSMDSQVQGKFNFWGPSGTPQFVFVDTASISLDFAGPGHGTGKVVTTGVAAGDRLAVPLIRSDEYEVQMTLVAHATVNTRTVEDWQLRVWNTLRDHAFAKFQAQQAILQDKRDKLWAHLAGKDTLTLRRMEREELLRGVLTWLLGPDFDVAPAAVSIVLKEILGRAGKNTADEIQPQPTLSEADWQTAAGFGDLVKFVHQAVEWENLLYFLYPYFWGSDDLGRDKLLFDHPDPNHRDFLRAGYARVVVPIRPGFEEKFTVLLNTGTVGGEPTPYLTIAEEVAAFARTNYQGIPPANPEKHTRPLLYPQQRQTWDTMQKVIDAIDAYAAANGRYPATLAELPGGGPFLDAWGNELVYRLPGSGNDYDLLSYGANGQEGGEDVDADISAAAGASLIATWFDYTPTSGIDIDVQTIPLT